MIKIINHSKKSEWIFHRRAPLHSCSRIYTMRVEMTIYFSYIRESLYNTSHSTDNIIIKLSASRRLTCRLSLVRVRRERDSNAARAQLAVSRHPASHRCRAACISATPVSSSLHQLQWIAIHTYELSTQQSG